MRAFLFILMILQGSTFKESQRQFTRVKTAYQEKEKIVKRYFEERNLIYEEYSLFIRAFKIEEEL